MDLRPHRRPQARAALEGRSTLKLYDLERPVAQSQYHFLWPNTTININSGFPNLSIDFARELTAFNKQVALEDDRLTDSVQRGLLGGLPERGRLLTSSEHLVVHFQKMVVKAMMSS